MKKIYCKNCGYVSHYGMLEKVSRILIFDAYENPEGSSDDSQIYASNIKRCLICGKKVTIVEVSESEVGE